MLRSTEMEALTSCVKAQRLFLFSSREMLTFSWLNKHLRERKWRRRRRERELDIIISAYPKLMMMNSGNPALADWFRLHAQSRAQKKILYASAINNRCDCKREQI
jgi:hypothetical protein